MKKYVVLFISLVAVFLFTRNYKIAESFFYLNDMGRDSLVLQNWQTSGKAPLLGPQTSALPFNQSAIYFYLLYPAFVISHGSPFSALATLQLFTLVVISITFFVLFRAKNTRLLEIFLLSFFLLILQPQEIVQSRFVWNPSFVTPLLFSSAIFLLLFYKNFTFKKAAVLGMYFAAAISFSYSVIPTVAALCLVSIFYLKKKALLLYGSIAAWLVVFNIPTLIFEVRHHFLLTNMMLHQVKLAQNGIDLGSKVNGLLQFVFLDTNSTVAAFAAIGTGIVLLSFFVFTIWKMIKFRQISTVDSDSGFFLFSTALALTFLLTFLAPIPVYAHYIFGIVTLGLLTVATLPAKLRIFLSTLLILLWCIPLFQSEYFKKAPRTVSELMSCYQQYCSKNSQPLFVSLQSGVLPFHNGPEHRYLLQRSGCNVKDIESESVEVPNQPSSLKSVNHMAVIVESSSFAFGKTSYAELTQFAPNQEMSRLNCQPNLQVVTLQR